eukprot:CAMPEP_0201738548 /NCGR_PEP_ID=MMETSP0593-20130828/45308_1 /ASSEMBLY_ACC=CAM_ASM_000672 /TAXON_ID=267983 /ORGANISM="Skeletonema japonicum, Strain CCMP2506" /LENGTH=456 /DNA_ID=CAMNT_0048232769 /DNA_START=8 /DNA_END=1378 /DNA_ORIENTATION=-
MTTPSSTTVLCKLPVLLLVIIAALDSADKALLAASFPMLEKTLGLHVDTLGYFSLFTNLSYALSLPLWGWIIHRYTVDRSHIILCTSCFLWGVATLFISISDSAISQALFRSLNGAALASIMPLSQMMLTEYVLPSHHGRAFGLMGFLEKIAATMSTSAVIWWEDWTNPYRFVGCLSIFMAVMSRSHLKMGRRKVDDKKNEEDEEEQQQRLKGEEKEMTLLQIFHRISQIPVFTYLVAQGLFGAIPWDMMSFILLLLEWKDFTRNQIISFQISAGVFGTLGAFLGGVLGDYFAFSPRGRIHVALTSVIGGTIFYGLFLFSKSYQYAVFWYSMFHLWGGWTPAATLRPICAKLAENASERAQIVAAWILLEKTSSAIFGAPLVGFLTKRLFDSTDNASDEAALANHEKADALAFNLFVLSTLFWFVCAYFFVLMARAEAADGSLNPKRQSTRKISTV